MRNLDLLRLAGAATLGIASVLACSSPASAFAGLSDRQTSHIEEYIHCRTLLWTDLDAFNADPVCGGTPGVDWKSMSSGPGSGYVPPREDDDDDEHEHDDCEHHQSKDSEYPLPA